MSNRLLQSYKVSGLSNIPITQPIHAGVVVDVILDNTHPLLKNIDNTDDFSTGKNTTAIGHCLIRRFDSTIKEESDLEIYAPYNPSDINLPIKGETVELRYIGSSIYYNRINHHHLNIGNAIENYNELLFSNIDTIKATNSYNSILKTGISNKTKNSDRTDSYGDYFTSRQINNLKLYEGDKLIQSRFGQSIRFSGYNNKDKKYAPSIIIRNQQSPISLNKLKSGDITEEDINRDGSIIAITSGYHTLNYQPGLIDDVGNTNFKTKPTHFKKYPSKLSNTNQILMNTDRIIISAKSKEMIFYSKGNWGFISDGHMSIDNGMDGATLDFNGDVAITTNSSKFTINSRKIYLNTDRNGNSPSKTGLNNSTRPEPLVRGQVLVDLLSDMIQAIEQQIYLTPTGPTASGPQNISEFERIKSKLNTLKSTLNFTE